MKANSAVPWRTIAALTIGACLFAAGWTAQGWRKDADIAEIRRAAAFDLVKAVDRARTDEQRWTDEQARIANDAKQQREMAVADARAAAATSERLRQQVAQLVAAGRARDTAPAIGSEATGDPLGVLADVLERADRRAGILAEALDASRIAGLACERSYDALTQSTGDD